MTMLRARRLASTAVVAALVAAGLAACQQSPDVAAYLGGGTIPQARVEKIYDQVRDELTTAQAAAASQAGSSPGAVAPATVPIKRQDVLNTLLSLDVLRRAAQAHNVKPAAEPTVDQVAQARSFSPQWEYTKLFAETYQLRAALQPVVPKATLTDADLRDVYQRLVGGGAADPATPFDQFKSTLGEENQTLLQTYVGLRDELEGIAADQKLKLNPRYGDQQVTLLSASAQSGGEVPLVVATFAGNSAEDPYVTDVSAVATVS